MRLFSLLPLVTLVTLGPLSAEDGVNNLLENGNLEESGLGGSGGWPSGKGISIGEEEGNHFLRLEAVEPGVQIQAYRKIPLPGGVQKLDISFRARAIDIAPGAESWHTGRVILHFKDAANQVVKPDPAPFAFKGNSDGWVEKSVQLTVPEGATFLEIFPALFQVGQGILDVDDVVVSPAD